MVVLIQELTRQASLDLLTRTRLCRLACTQGTQPYVTPVYLAYADHALYGFATVGQKIDWMRANPLVCVEADEVVSPQEWVSVIVFGRYEELADTPELQSARASAYELLWHKNGVWWEPAAKTPERGSGPLVPIWYRIHIVRITGHRATPDPGGSPGARPSIPESGESSWFQRLLPRLRRWSCGPSR